MEQEGKSVCVREREGQGVRVERVVMREGGMERGGRKTATDDGVGAEEEEASDLS